MAEVARGGAAQARHPTLARDFAAQELSAIHQAVRLAFVAGWGNGSISGPVGLLPIALQR